MGGSLETYTSSLLLNLDDDEFEGGNIGARIPRGCHTKDIFEEFVRDG